LANSFWFEKYFIETKEFYLGNAKKESTSIKVLQISDLHLKSVGYHLKNLAKHINTMKPDLIMITGDAIEKASKIWELDRFLGLIDFEIPKVAIMGNWEYFGFVDNDELSKMYAKHNCELLLNTNKRFQFASKTFSITGVDDYISGNSDIETALKSHQKSDYHLVLNHCPAYTREIIEHQKILVNRLIIYFLVTRTGDKLTSSASFLFYPLAVVNM